MTTRPHTASVTLDASTEIVAKPAKNGWNVVAVTDGQERPLGRSTVLGPRRAIHDVLRERNHATTRTVPGRHRAQRPKTRDAATRRVSTAASVPPGSTAGDDQAAAWAALKRAVARPRKSAEPAQPNRTRARPTGATQPAPTTHKQPTPRTPAAAATRDRKAAAGSAVTPPAKGPAWGVHVTLEQVAGDTTTTTTGTAVAEISRALSGALRDALGDRTGGRVRKALRRHGLITKPAVFEHEHTGRGGTQRLRIHVTPLDATAAVNGDAAAVICERTRHLPARRDVALLGA